MSSPDSKTARSAMYVLACLIVTVFTAPVSAETVKQSRPVGPEGVVLGDPCKRRTDDAEGVVKIDACGRWYCGRVDTNDITVLNPDFARDMQCEWKIVANRCKCVRPLKQ